MTEGLLIDRSSEHGDNLPAEYQVNETEHNTAGQRHNHGIAYTLFCPLRPLHAETQADEGAAAITDHHGEGQGYHRQREYHRIGSIAEGPEVGGIGNKNLVHDIIQGSHQQGDNAGNRILPHKAADGFGPQKLICCFHKRYFLSE